MGPHRPHLLLLDRATGLERYRRRAARRANFADVFMRLSLTAGRGLFDIDRDYAAFADRVKLPNRPEAEPQVLLLAEPVRDAVLRWAIPA